MPSVPDRRDDLRRVARQDHAPGRVNLRFIQHFEEPQGELGIVEIGIVRDFPQGRQVARVEPEQRQRHLLRFGHVKDGAQEQFAPQVSDRLHERIQARRAGHRLAVEDPVEGQAVVGLEDRVADRPRAIRRGDAVAGDGDALLDAHHRPGQIGRDEQTTAPTNPALDHGGALGGPLVRVEHARQDIPFSRTTGREDGDSVEKVQREADVA